MDIELGRTEQDAIAEYSGSHAGIQFFCLGGSEAGGEGGEGTESKQLSFALLAVLKGS